MKWSEEKLNTLIELYPNHTNKYISVILNISIPIISKKAKELQIKKTKEHKSKIVKDRTRDLSYENLKEIAKKYKTKSDFQKNDSSAYSASGVLGIKNEICSHMITQNISRPQLILKYIIEKIFKTKNVLYSTRKIIKPYELDVYLPNFKLAFEYDGLYWHKNNKEIDDKKDKLCIKNKILLIRIKEVSGDCKDYLKSIKDKLISYLIKINNYSKENIMENQINDITEYEVSIFINDNTIDYNIIKEITLKYNNYKEFKTSEKRLYCKLLGLGIIKKFTSHMKKDIIYWDIKLCQEEIDKYHSFEDFYKKSYKCYIYIQRNNLYYLLNNFNDYSKFYVKTQRINDEYIINIVKNIEIKTLEFFKLQHNDIYAYLVRNKKLYMIKNLEKKHNKHDVSEIFNHNYSKYKNLHHFNNENKALFSFMLRKNLLEFVKNKINRD